jgi:flagellar biosynthetic protein FlhB
MDARAADRDDARHVSTRRNPCMLPETMHTLFWEVFLNGIVVLVPLMLVVMTGRCFGNVAQFGFLFTGEKLSPNLAKLNPISGSKN